MPPIVEHPDTLSDYRALKHIRRGSRQAADTAAMEAMFDAIEAGKSREEAEKVFFNTYKEFICANKETNVASLQVGTILKRL